MREQNQKTNRGCGTRTWWVCRLCTMRREGGREEDGERRDQAMKHDRRKEAVARAIHVKRQGC